jgi:hypothetical protein
MHIMPDATENIGILAGSMSNLDLMRMCVIECSGVWTYSIDWADATRGVAGSLGGLLAELRGPIVRVAGGLCMFPARRVPGAVVKNKCRLKQRGAGLLGR